MSSVHQVDSLGDITLLADTTTVCTSTGQYLAVFLSGNYSVAPIATITNFAQFLGITQNYATAVGDPIRVRVQGVSKCLFSGANTITSAGLWAQPDVATTTAWGQFILQDRVQADATAGAVFLAGQILAISSASGTVGEILIRPSFSTALTSTVGI